MPTSAKPLLLVEPVRALVLLVDAEPDAGGAASPGAAATAGIHERASDARAVVPGQHVAPC